MSGYVPPKKGLDLTPQTGIPAPSVRRGGADPAGGASDEAVVRASPVIGAWIAAQRQNVACSAIDVHQRHLDHPDADVRYQNVQGRETITISPKPKAAPPQPATTPSVQLPPNGLVELARTEEITPQTPVFMLVLYGKNEWALFDIENPDDPALTYNGKAEKTTWSTTGQLLTLQLKLGKTQFILLPIDLTGQIATTHAMLSTNALGDAFETVGDLRSIPVMAGDGDALYTSAGAYALDSEQGFKLLVPLRVDGNGSFQVPTAIDSSGNCYFLPTCTAPIGIRLDPTSVPTFAFSQDLGNKVSQKQSDAADKSTVPSLFAADVAFLDYDKATEHQQGLTYSRDDVTTFSTTVFSIGPTKAQATVAGAVYYGAATFGGPMQCPEFSCAFADTDALSYTLSSNSYEPVTSLGSRLLQGHVPLQRVDKDGTSQPKLFPVNGSVRMSITLEVDDTKREQVAAFAHDTISGNSSKSGTEETFSVGGRLSEADAQVKLSSYGQAQGVYQRTVQAMAQGASGSAAYQATPLETQYTQSPPDSFMGSASGDIMWSETAPDPFPFADNDYLEASLSHGDETYYAASKINFPTSKSYNSSTTSLTKLSFAGQQFEANEKTSMAFLLHAFPPLMSDTLFYTLLRQDQLPLIVTPYGNYTGMSNESYQPWLHINNGTHSIQGYVIDGKPHLFADGGSTDIIDKLATALDVDPSSIVTCLLDITKAKAQALDHVQPGQRN